MSLTEPLPLAQRAPNSGFANGWFCVAESADARDNTLHPIYFFNRQLIVYRTSDGVARVSDAFCPHLGAHLASHNGALRADRIVCPFHRWQWNAVSGECASIPYCDRVPRVSLELFPTREVDGMVLMWHHSKGLPPDHEPYCAGIVEQKDMVPYETKSWTATAPFRDVLENFADTAHVVSLHGYVLPTLTAMERTPQGLRMELGLNYSLGAGAPDARMVCNFSGISLLFQSFELGPARLAVTHSFTPIDQERMLHKCRLFVSDLGSRDLTLQMGKQFAERFYFDVEQDLKVLNFKKHLTQPKLCAGDGPIMHFRNYQDSYYA